MNDETRTQPLPAIDPDADYYYTPEPAPQPYPAHAGPDMGPMHTMNPYAGIPPQAPQQQDNTTAGIFSIILGALSILTCWMIFPPFPLTLISGVLYVKSRKDGAKNTAGFVLLLINAAVCLLCALVLVLGMVAYGLNNYISMNAIN